MRRVAWALLLLFAFAVPWEHSLDFGEPFGSIARIVMILLLPVSVLAVVEARRIRRPGLVHAAVLVLFIYFACTCLWSIDKEVTLERMRTYAQEMVAVGLIWEFADDIARLRALLRAYVAGSWVLASLTLVDFAVRSPIDQIRYAAVGQDPNDVARLLGIAIPLACYLFLTEQRRWVGIAALVYVHVSLLDVLLTGSRSGLLTATIALLGCALLIRWEPRAVMGALLALSVAFGIARIFVPPSTWTRLATIPEQFRTGDLNQRLNIWDAGWSAFRHAPLIGSGAGTFVGVSGLAAEDTAHNTTLSLAVEGGVVALLIASFVVIAICWYIAHTDGKLRLTLMVELVVLLAGSFGATIEATRSSWFFVGVFAAAGSIALRSIEAASVNTVEPVDRAVPEGGLA